MDKKRKHWSDPGRTQVFFGVMKHLSEGRSVVSEGGRSQRTLRYMPNDNQQFTRRCGEGSHFLEGSNPQLLGCLRDGPHTSAPTVLLFLLWKMNTDPAAEFVSQRNPTASYLAERSASPLTAGFASNLNRPRCPRLQMPGTLALY